MWWWLSFADADRPKGQQALGVAIVKAPHLVLAIKKAWALGINPGGEVMGFIVEKPALHQQNRLISPKELLQSDIGEKCVRRG